MIQCMSVLLLLGGVCNGRFDSYTELEKQIVKCIARCKPAACFFIGATLVVQCTFRSSHVLFDIL